MLGLSFGVICGWASKVYVCNAYGLTARRPMTKAALDYT